VITMKAAVGDVPAVTLNYGKFIQAVVDFVIVAFAIFPDGQGNQRAQAERTGKAEELAGLGVGRPAGNGRLHTSGTAVLRRSSRRFLGWSRKGRGKAPPLPYAGEGRGEGAELRSVSATRTTSNGAVWGNMSKGRTSAMR